MANRGAHPDAGLSPEEVKILHRMLISKRSELLREHADHLDSARFSERIAEPEEAAAQEASQATMIDLAESERLRLLEVDRALGKMDHGTYGVSEESGEPIGFARLQAIPWARFSAEDQERRERERKDLGR